MPEIFRLFFQLQAKNPGLRDVGILIAGSELSRVLLRFLILFIHENWLFQA